jgi:hypothetical protein
MKRILGVLSTLAICSIGFSQATITGWTVQTDIIPGNQTQMAGATMCQGKMFLCGGNALIEGDTSGTYRFSINSGTGALGTADPFTALPTNANYAYINGQTVATSNHIYIAGGGWNAVGPNRNNVTYIGVDAGGNATDPNWLESAAMPGGYDPELGAAVICANGYLYAFGGDGAITPAFDTCVYAPINPDGSLGAWTTAGVLPGTTWFPAACSIGNYIITSVGVWNGTSNAQASDKVLVCQVNPNGSMGSWVEQVGAPLPVTLYGTQLMAVGNTVFAVGGRTTGGTTLNAVYRAVFNPGTGTLGAWTSADAQLPDGVRYHCAVYDPASTRIIVSSIRRGSDAAISNEAYISSAMGPITTVADWHIY